MPKDNTIGENLNFYRRETYSKKNLRMPVTKQNPQLPAGLTELFKFQ